MNNKQGATTLSAPGLVVAQLLPGDLESPYLFRKLMPRGIPSAQPKCASERISSDIVAVTVHSLPARLRSGTVDCLKTWTAVFFPPALGHKMSEGQLPSSLFSL